MSKPSFHDLLKQAKPIDPDKTEISATQKVAKLIELQMTRDTVVLKLNQNGATIRIRLASVSTWKMENDILTVVADGYIWEFDKENSAKLVKELDLFFFVK